MRHGRKARCAWDFWKCGIRNRHKYCDSNDNREKQAGDLYHQQRRSVAVSSADKTVKSEETKPVTKPRFKVEEVVEEPAKEEVSVEKAEVKEKEEKKETPVIEETPKEEPTEEKSETTTPKVTSFSMVDKTSVSEEPKAEPTTTDTQTPVQSETMTTPESTETQQATGSDVSASEIQEWLQNVRPETPPATGAEKGGSMGKVLAVLLVLLILGALGGGVYYYQKNVAGTTTTNNEVTKNTPEVTTAPTETPTPTVASVDLSKYKVQVLNGSGTPGEAGKAQGYLETAGFKEFKTGNASAFNYTKTEVSLKASVSDEVFTAIEKALSSHYQDVTKVEKALSDSSEYDVVITVGKQK
jgi:outer membrane biosynthesis protein TonB